MMQANLHTISLSTYNKMLNSVRASLISRVSTCEIATDEEKGKTILTARDAFSCLVVEKGKSVNGLWYFNKILRACTSMLKFSSKDRFEEKLFFYVEHLESYNRDTKEMNPIDHTLAIVFISAVLDASKISDSQKIKLMMAAKKRYPNFADIKITEPAKDKKDSSKASDSLEQLLVDKKLGEALKKVLGLETKKDVMDELAKLIPEDVSKEVDLGPPPPPPAGDPPEVFVHRPLVIGGRSMASAAALAGDPEANMMNQLRAKVMSIRKDIEKSDDESDPDDWA